MKKMLLIVLLFSIRSFAASQASIDNLDVLSLGMKKAEAVNALNPKVSADNRQRLVQDLSEDKDSLCIKTINLVDNIFDEAVIQFNEFNELKSCFFKKKVDTPEAAVSLFSDLTTKFESKYGEAAYDKNASLNSYWNNKTSLLRLLVKSTTGGYELSLYYFSPMYSMKKSGTTQLSSQHPMTKTISQQPLVKHENTNSLPKPVNPRKESDRSRSTVHADL